MEITTVLILGAVVALAAWMTWDLVIWPILFGDYDKDTPV